MSDEIKNSEMEGVEEKLTDKQRAFCIEYPKDFNATQAAIRAGYSDNPDSARNQGSELLAKPCIRAEIDRILRAREDAQREEIRSRVLEELSKIAMDDMSGSDAIRDKEGNPIGVSRKDRLKALELLGKYSALFVDKVELGGQVKTGPIVDPSELSESAKAELAQVYARNLERH